MKKIQLEKILQHRCFLLLFLYKSLKQSTFDYNDFIRRDPFLVLPFFLFPFSSLVLNK